MSLAVWIGLGVAVWLVLAVLLALLIGKIIRRRDGQRSRVDGPPPRAPTLDGYP